MRIKAEGKTYDYIVKKFDNIADDLDILTIDDFDGDRLPPFPDEIKIRRLELINCVITQITFPPGITEFYSENCQNLLKLPELPDTLTSLNVVDGNLDQFPTVLPSGLKYISFSFNNIKTIPNIEWPSNMESIDVEKNEMEEILSLPRYLKNLQCSNNKLSYLPDKLPDGLQHLNCNNNNLVRLPDLPDTLEYLYCQNNLLTALPPLPESLEVLNCKNNHLEYIPPLPKSIKGLYYDDNPLKEFPRIHFHTFINPVNDQVTQDLQFEQFNQRIATFGWKPVRKMPTEELWEYVDLWYDYHDEMMKEYNSWLEYMGLPPTDKVPRIETYKQVAKDASYQPGGEMYKTLGIGKNWEASTRALEMTSLNMSLRDIAALSGWTDPLVRN